MKKHIITTSRERRRLRIRAKIAGDASRPRLSVYKSNAAMYAQIIDDDASKTIVGTSSLAAEIASKSKNKTDAAKKVGMEIAKMAKAKNITKVVFDRGGFIYTGRIKALAEGAREGGLEF